MSIYEEDSKNVEEREKQYFLPSQNEHEEERTDVSKELECKVYKRRWVMLGLFIGFAFVNNIQWIQYAIINNLVMKYYNVDSVAVDWTSIIFMAGYIPLIFPAMYLLEKKVSGKLFHKTLKYVYM